MRVKPVRAGMVVAAIIAGPPLYGLVRSDSMDSWTAIERGGLVALACAVGISWLAGIIADYQRDVRVARIIRAKLQSMATVQPPEMKAGPGTGQRTGGPSTPPAPGSRAQQP